jgi:hypothetical protein
MIERDSGLEEIAGGHAGSVVFSQC